MPGFDGTGPRGMGPMTGRGMGFCSSWGIGAAYRGRMVPPYQQAPYPYYGGYAPYGSPVGMPYYGGYAPPGASPYYGAGYSPGAAPYAPQMTREQELDLLRSEAEAVKEQLGQIEARISGLEAEG